MERNRNSTRRNYHTIWKLFSKFFLKLDSKPREWENQINLFAGYLINNKKSVSTVRSYIAAIKSVLREDEIEISEDKYLLTSLTRACQYHVDKVQLRLPIRKPILHKLLDQVNKTFLNSDQPQPYLAKLYRAIFVSAYFGLLRVGEIAKGSHPVLAKDVEIGTNKDKIKFTLHTSKTHWKNVEPQVVKFGSIPKKQGKAKQEAYCPYTILRSYLKARPTYAGNSEPFFVFSDRSPVLPHKLNKLLKSLTALPFSSNSCGNT